MIEEKPKNDPIPAPESGLDDIAALLAEQVAASHAAAARCFALADDETEMHLPARNDALKIATRLMQANASAARAINRIKGSEFHYRVTVNRIDVNAENAARKARKAKAKNDGKDAKARLEAKLDRLHEAARAKLTDEEKAVLDKMAGKWPTHLKSPAAVVGTGTEREAAEQAAATP